MYSSKVFVLLSGIVLLLALKKGALAQSVSCPVVRTTSGWLDLFPLPCRKRTDCTVMGARHLCCKGFCTKGVTVTTTELPSASSVESTTSTTTPKPTTTTTPKPTTTTPKPTTTTTTTTTTPKPTTTSTTTTTTTTTTTPKPTTTTTPAPRPFLQFLPIQSTKKPTNKNKTVGKSGKKSTQKLVCPKPGQAPLVLFPIPCEKSSQCRSSSGADHVCCDGRCVRGVQPPRPKTTPPPKLTHQPLLGVIPRECPSAPLGELLFEVQSCKSDAECWPRLCCPDGKRSYCRTARARLDLVPIANQIDGPVRSLEKYLQCTPPPQYDLYPKQCSSSVDCFPNLCCAEGGKRHCRPPQRSLLALLAGVTQRFGSYRQAQRAQTNDDY